MLGLELKLENGEVISFHTLQSMWLLIYAGVTIKPYY